MKMKIVVVVPYLKSFGGASRYAWELSEYLATQGDDVVVASLYTDKTTYSSDTKLRTIDFGNEKNLTQSINFWINIKKIIKDLHKIIDQEKPDIVFFNHYPCTMWVEKYDNLPIICYPHDINLLYTNTYINNLPTKTRILWRIIRLFVRSYDKRKWKLFDEVISHSKFTAQNIQKHYGINAPIMYLGTNTKVFSPNSNNNKKNAILTLGDTKIRRADLLIKAASKLRKKRNDFEIWIVGSKNEIDLELKNLVKTLHIEENIKFFGQISDSKLSKLYSEALVTAHLVKEAPFGLIVIESMSCGTPVISWKPGGPEETIIHGETGFLIPENNENALIEKIEMFLNSPDLSNKMGKKSRERVEKYFDLAQHHSHMREHLLNWINKKTRE